jgi:hypothetical protein
LTSVPLLRLFHKSDLPTIRPLNTKSWHCAMRRA